MRTKNQNGINICIYTKQLYICSMNY
jgi:hypothetical protein